MRVSTNRSQRRLMAGFVSLPVIPVIGWGWKTVPISLFPCNASEDPCAGEANEPVARERKPDACGVVPGGGDDARAVGAEGRARQGAVVVLECVKGLSGGGIPDARRVVLGGGNDARAVGAKGRAGQGALVASECVKGLSGGGIPDEGGAVP